MTEDDYGRLIDMTTSRVAEQVNALHEHPSPLLGRMMPLFVAMNDSPPLQDMLMGMYPDATTILN